MKRHALHQVPIFVYGTLMPGQPNDHLWQDGIRALESAIFTSGKLYDMGYYPMLVEERGGRVKGKLITVHSGRYEETLNRLDNLEGFNPDNPALSSFKRVVRPVLTENGQTVSSWLYIGRKEDAQKRRVIPDGDWGAYAAQLRS